MDGLRTRRMRDTSPNRVRVMKSCRKVQVVYYLTRNGQLEHPHYMEVSLVPNQHLRLKDVMDKLNVLRGKGMPSMFSWSCKRSYKNGYVWNDLSENDIIHPAEGAEYVLKGSELIEGCTEKFQQIRVNNRQQIHQEQNFHSKSKQISPNDRFQEQIYYNVDDDEEEYEYEEKTSCISELPEESESTQKNRTELTLTDSSPPSTSSTISDKPNQNINSKRFEDNSITPSRNSVLFQLIACGSSSVAKAKAVPTVYQPIKSVGKGVLCKSAAAKTAAPAVEEEDMKMISYMSENPRFGNLQSEEKEYFSGSMAESMAEDRVVTESVLKKSNSYNERCGKSVMGEAAVEEEKREEKAARGKCIPLIKSRK